MKSLIMKLWNNPEGLQISDMGINTIPCTFSDEIQAKRIMEGAPWHILGNLFSLQHWAPQISIFEINFDLVPYWVQIHGLPLECMSTSNVNKIAEQIGSVLVIENPKVDGVLLRTFFRARICVDITKPLPTGFWVPRRQLPKTWVYLKYERLQGTCYKCGVVGNEQRDCQKPRAMAICDPLRPRYGPNLAVSAARSLASLVTTVPRRQRQQEPEQERRNEDHNA